MSIQDEEKEILELWDRILEEPEVHKSLVYLWEHRRELRKLEAKIQSLESHVLEILRNLPNLRKHSYGEFRALCEQLVGYLHNIEPTKGWVKKITKDLDLLVQEANMGLARARERILAEKRAHIIPMLKIVKLIAEFYRTFNTNQPLIEQKLKDNGLESLKGDYERFMKGLNALKGNGQVPIDESEAQRVYEDLITELSMVQNPNSTSFTIYWGYILIPKFQFIIEALPRETGLIDLAQADAVSNQFHKYVGELYLAIKARYYPLRLYIDDLQSPNTEPVMYHTHGAYGYGNPQNQAEIAISLKRLFPDIHHGTILRVSRPSYHLHGNIANELKISEWDGVFQYLVLPG